MYTPATQLTADMSAEYAIGGLTPGVSYTVTVTPVNRAGEGPRTEIGVNTVSVGKCHVTITCLSHACHLFICKCTV